MINSKLAALLSFVFITSLSGCSAIDGVTDQSSKTQYEYPHQCTRNGELVNHLITARLPLTLKELRRLNPTLQESLQLDYMSCKFVGDLEIINSAPLVLAEENAS